MKRILFFLLITTIRLNAQMYYMPDSMLKVKLTNLGYGGCIVGDSINSSCSQVANATFLDVSNSAIHSLAGIEAFGSLNKINCGDNSNLVIDSFPANLDSIECGNCNLNSLPSLPDSLLYLVTSLNNLSQLPALPNSLRFLHCEFNILTSLPALGDSLRNLLCDNNRISIIPTLPQSLEILGCSYNDLTSIPVLPSTLAVLLCDSNNITSLPALPGNLLELSCYWNQLTSLPTLPPSLQKLSCWANLLNSLPALPGQLVDLDCSTNQLTAIPSLPAGLQILNCYGNLLNTLPVLPSSLKELWIGNNQFTSIQALPPSLFRLRCEGNPLNALPYLHPGLLELDCSDCGLTALPTLPSSLNWLMCANNNLSTLPDLPPFMSDLDCRNNSQLHCLPELTTINALYFYNCPVTCIPNYGTVATSGPALSSMPLCDIFNSNSCSFYWNISGRTYFDADTNCIHDVTDKNLSNMKVKLLQGGNLVQQVFTGGEGLFSFDVNTFGNYSVVIDTSNNPFKVLCPSSGQYIDTISITDSLIYSNDFSVECKNGYDVGAWSIVAQMFRPAHRTKVNFRAGDYANYFGVSCANGISGTITVAFSGNVHYFGPVAGFPAPSNVTGNVITYFVPDFGLMTSYLAFELETDAMAVFGSSVCIDVNVNPISGDFNPSNNLLTNCFTVMSAYDPNDKLVYPEGIIDTSVKWLNYTIRFQNTGNATADNIYIIDTINSNFDLSTFQLVASSHPAFVQVLNGGIARFNFPNINLPDSGSDEEMSHGFIQYKIKLKDNLLVGTQIVNTGYIYFDFNAPVVTNTTYNIIDLPNSVSGIQYQELSIKAFPQPFSDHLILEGNFKNVRYNIVDVYGRVINSGIITGLLNVNTAEWKSGFYILKLENSKSKTLIKY